MPARTRKKSAGSGANPRSAATGEYGSERADGDNAQHGEEQRSAGSAPPERHPMGPDDEHELQGERLDEPPGTEQCKSRAERPEHEREGEEVDDVNMSIDVPR